MSFGAIGMPEILMIGALLAILFGPSRLPKIGKGLGEGIRELRSALRSMGGDDG